ncbi:hypothetical protein [Ferrimonas gelatinilytica]|uniref:Outer membrane protein beta-barrel domain-containing protein n=1 Tax=Ferrimonas gelatinilytica TaxID=1255257 RepID=A0ABP9S103_9GAMM
MFKKVASAAVLLLGSLPFSALGEIGIGFQLGKPDAVSIGVNRWDIGVSVDDVNVSVDRRFTTRELPNLYFGVGGQVSDNGDAPLGVRGKVGLSARAGFAELFGEVVPTVTFGSRGDFELNYGLGFRIWF